MDPVSPPPSNLSLFQLSATDTDSDKRIEYRLLSVSNNGIRKFSVDAGSGRVNVIGPVRAGEHYSLTVAALDSGGKANQAIMDVSYHKHTIHKLTNLLTCYGTVTCKVFY